MNKPLKNFVQQNNEKKRSNSIDNVNKAESEIFENDNTETLILKTNIEVRKIATLLNSKPFIAPKFKK